MSGSLAGGLGVKIAILCRSGDGLELSGRLLLFDIGPHDIDLGSRADFLMV
jgi:hypothetical protein